METDSDGSGATLVNAPAELDKALEATGGSTFMICANVACNITARVEGAKMYRAHINLDI